MISQKQSASVKSCDQREHPAPPLLTGISTRSLLSASSSSENNDKVAGVELSSLTFSARTWKENSSGDPSSCSCKPVTMATNISHKHDNTNYRKDRAAAVERQLVPLYS
ncbi:hypothetical protein CesoFtcFv8_005766 [Champsocephalus esox]|uniref:Uncharacterized protein n=1 Tax=Champsocephalus esox TaxID=159716 RepID=A0AAN8H6D8_9TELE|nr:hypothetical protein CesoFtcFv8_005766 [Champsocephalus esox]